MTQARRQRTNYRRDDLHREPTLSEMLADPIVRARMAVDGVSDDDIVALMRRPRPAAAAA